MISGERVDCNSTAQLAKPRGHSSEYGGRARECVSTDNVEDRIAAVGDGDRTAQTVGNHHVRIDPQQVIDRGHHVARRYRMTGRVRRQFVAGTEHRPRSDPASCEQAEAAPRPMIPSCLRVHPRRAAHFPHDDHQRRNPYFPGAAPRIDVPEIAGNAPVFPISPLLERFNDYHTANRFTSACSAMIYRDDLFGPHFAGNAFIVRQKAEAAFATSVSADRQKVINQYQSAIALPGDPVRGSQLFAKLCAQCHKLAGVGHEVGPDLTSLTDKSSDALLVAVLDPNRAVETKFLTFVAETKAGLTFRGIQTGQPPGTIFSTSGLLQR